MNKSLVLNVTKCEILFSLKRFKSFTQCQLGKVLPHNMFLLSDRRMPSHPECRRSTRGVVSSDSKPSRVSQEYQRCCFVAGCTCFATSTTTTSPCIVSRSCRAHGLHTVLALLWLHDSELLLRSEQRSSRQIYETPFGSRPVNLKWAESGTGSIRKWLLPSTMPSVMLLTFAIAHMR